MAVTSQASTSAAQLSYLEEETFGVTPAVGAPKLLRMTGEDLNFDYSMEQSAEINATRQVSDAIITDASATGGFNFKMQYREYDPFIEALLCSEFAVFGVGGVKTLTVTFNKTNRTITGGAGDFTGLVVGQYIGIKESTKNNGHYRITTNTGAVLTVDEETPLLDDEASVEVEVSSSRVTVGTGDLRSFSIEKSFTDVDQYFMHRGRAISRMELSFATGQILTGSFGTIGKDVIRADATQFAEAAVPAEAFGISSAVTGVGQIFVRNKAGSSILGGAYINSANIVIDGVLREQKAIGHLGAIGIGKGTYSITGTLELYLATGSIYDAALANQLISVVIPTKDVEGNGYAFIFNNVKLNVPSVAAGAKDQDVMLSCPFTAVAPSSAVDKMIIVDRFGDSAVTTT
ncbi:MAG: phage tail tube protein [Wenzhouxiangella sp.]